MALQGEDWKGVKPGSAPVLVSEMEVEPWEEGWRMGYQAKKG